MMSFGPPAAKATTTRTGRVGYACALATCGANGSAAAPAAKYRNLRRGSFIAVPLCSAGSFDHLVGADETVRDFCLTGCYGKPAEPEIGGSHPSGLMPSFLMIGHHFST